MVLVWRVCVLRVRACVPGSTRCGDMSTVGASGCRLWLFSWMPSRRSGPLGVVMDVFVGVRVCRS